MTLYEDSAGTTQASVGGPVGRVEDVSGNGHHATQSTTANKPTLREDANGKLYLEFAYGDSLDTGLQSSKMAEAYALPSIGGATLRHEGKTSTLKIRHTTGPIAIVDSEVAGDTASALADYYETAAHEYEDGLITDLTNHLRGHSDVVDASGMDAWDTSQVTSMEFMFRETSVSNLSPISGWDTSQVTSMRYMFGNTSVSDPRPISGWDVANVSNLTSFLEDAPIGDAQTGDMLNGWTDGSPNTAADMQSGVSLGIGNADYTGMDSGGQAAVDALCSDRNWTINAANAPANCS